MAHWSPPPEADRPEPLPLHGVIVIALAFSLSVGFSDVLVSVLPAPSGLYAFSMLLWPLAATFTGFFALFLGSWVLVANPLRRFLKLDATPSIISLGFFLGVSFLLVSLARFPLQPINLVKFFLLLVVVVMVSAGAFFTAKIATKHPERRRRGVACFFTAPFLIAEFLLFVWGHVYRVGSFFSTGSYLVLGALTATLAITLRWGYRVERPGTMKRLVVVLAAVVVTSPFLSLPFTSPDVPAPVPAEPAAHAIRHVILITVDTLRRDALSCYAPAGIGTPHMDRLAADGIRFTNALAAAPWTLPSVSSIMTGLSPAVHRASRPGTRMPASLPTLAESMRDAGYRTGAVVSNAFLGPQFNFAKGFEDYDFYPKYSIGDSFGARLLQRFFPGRFPSDITTGALTARAVAWLEGHHDEDFFLWVHYFDPHSPYTPPERFIPDVDPPAAIGDRLSEERTAEIHRGTFVPSLAERAWIQTLYQGEVRYVDEGIGRITDALERLGIYDQALIVLTSDHGEEFWEHDRFEHGHTLYNEVLRVPLIVKLPGTSPPEGRVAATVPTQAIGPTILDVCGIDGGARSTEVVSFAPLWGPAGHDIAGRPIVSQGLYFFENRESVVFEGHKYIHFLITDREELYDLRNDPGEAESILADAPDLAREAREILARHETRAGELRARYGLEKGETAEIDETTLGRLRALGYL